MNAKELSALLKALDLSPASCGRFLGVTQRTVSNWLEGGKIPEPSARFLAYVAAAGLTPGQVMKTLGLDGPHLPPSKK